MTDDFGTYYFVSLYLPVNAIFHYIFGEKFLPELASKGPD